MRYFFCWSIENWCLHVCLNPCEGFSDKILLNYFIILKESYFEINFQAIIPIIFLNLLQMFIIVVQLSLLEAIYLTT